ncbi:MAG: MFS transporter [Burkholderiales bacterium]
MPISRLPRTVIVLSLVSFFNDLASEMVVPLIPLLLVSVLAAGPVALGLIEGVADAVASLLKLWSGRRSDSLGGQRKGFAVAGYGLSNTVRPLFGLAGSWPVLLLLRSLDRVGKGLRSAPRDALIVDVTPPAMRGLAFGLHRAFDNAGAVGGSLIAAAVLSWSGQSLAQVILWSAVPGAISVLLIALGVGGRPQQNIAAKPAEAMPVMPWSQLPQSLRRYLWVLMLFTFARVSETFIVFRGHELGMNVVTLLLLWAMLNLTKAVTSLRGGSLADRIGKEPVILFAWAAFGFCFIGFGWVSTQSGLWIATLFFGLFAGLAEGPERALISDFAGEKYRGTAYGWYHLMVGIAAIPAGLLFGSIWHTLGAETAFRYAGVMALCAGLLMHFWAWPVRIGASR